MTKDTKFTHGPNVTVNVTQEIIDNAIEANSSHCVIADSLKAALAAISSHRYKNVSVDLATIRVTDKVNEKRYIYFTPQKCQRLIAQFDQGLREVITPIQFRLTKPVQVVNAKIKSGLNIDGSKKEMSEKHKSALAKNRKRQNKATAKLAKIGREVDETRHNASSQYQKVGGTPIPKMSALGNRRTYGIKGMGELNAPTDPLAENDN